MSMRLHLSCAPYPSTQGTQAAVHAMVRAERRAGLDATLLTYGAPQPDDPPHLERIAAPPLRVPERSGPNLARLGADLSVVAALRARRPDEIVAHHLEAALACVLAGVPFVYVAHTHVGDELPSYGATTRTLAPLGAAVESLVVRRARATFAVTPALAARFPGACTLPIPWPVEPPPEPGVRAEVRALLGVPEDTVLVLHAGNLDAYQNLPGLARAVARLARTRPARLLVATSLRRPLPPLDGPAPLLLPLDDGRDRCRAHAAADVAASARTLATGVPVKLLDAMARDVPVAAYASAFAGDSIASDAVVTAPDDDALAAGIAEAAGRTTTRPHEALRRTHADANYLTAAGLSYGPATRGTG